jgi:transmembrane sensor
MSSPKLPAPIRGLLDERLRDADVRRLWQGLEARRIRRRHPTFRRAAWPLAFASALVGAALVFVLMRRAEPPVLHFANGRDVPQALQTSGSPVLFDDGSRIELGSSARLDLLESTPRTFAVALRTGEARFSVKPGGPRAWKIECGPVTVEVVGTQFTLTREDGRLRVSVEHGAVLVSGTPVPDHVVRLGASDTIVIPLSSPAEPVAGEADTELPAMVAEAPPAAPSAAVLVERPRAIPEAPSGAESVATSADAGARASAPEPPQISARAWLAVADDARVAGRFQEAAQILETVLTTYSTDPSAALAEFSLARLYLDSLGNPALAATHLAGALARGLPASLTQDAFARLVEAHARSGNQAAANEVAARYRALYPMGRRLADVDRWASHGP